MLTGFFVKTVVYYLNHVGYKEREWVEKIIEKAKEVLSEPCGI